MEILYEHRAQELVGDSEVNPEKLPLACWEGVFHIASDVAVLHIPKVVSLHMRTSMSRFQVNPSEHPIPSAPLM